MTPAEAAELLAYAGGFDSRKPSIVAATAWAEALKDIPLDQDTRAAVAAFYGSNTLDASTKYDPTKRRWLEPHHVRFHRQQIRNARSGAVNAPYPGNPDETPEQFTANVRALNHAVGDGRIRPRAIESGTGVDATGRAHAILAALQRETVSKRPEFAAPCPHCAAEAGKPCTTGHGRKLLDAHPTRIEASRLLRVGETPIDRDELEREQQQRLAASRRAAEAQPSTFVPPGRDEPQPDEAP